MMNMVAGCLMGLASAASASPYLLLQGHNFANLTLNDTELTLNVPYPGMGGHACGIELRASNQYGALEGLKPLADALEVVEDRAGVLQAAAPVAGDPITLRYQFPKASLHKYMTLIRLKTKDGSSLAQTIANTIKPSVKDDPQPEVIVLLTNCR